MSAGQPLVTARALSELKDEIARRTRENLTPVAGIGAEDAGQALAAIKSLERDAWAQAFAEVADRHLARAHELELSAPEGAREEFRHAWRLFNFARWPVENTPLKRYLYPRALAAFRNHGRLLDPPLEMVRIPFENEAIVGYLRLPHTPRPAPLVVGISGLDSRKEDVMANAGACLSLGIGLFALDMPGTGEAPVALEPGAERMFSRALDYLARRPEVDAGRIVIQGRSWSGYWAAKLAHVERDRIRGAVVHGGPIHHYFQPDWLPASLETREYLCDYAPATSAMFGVTTIGELCEQAPRYSLLDQGLLDRPSAPMLAVNGAQDSQIPIDDLFLLLRHGSVKEAWINPQGGHMGRSREWSSRRILHEVVMPWIGRILA